MQWPGRPCRLEWPWLLRRDPGDQNDQVDTDVHCPCPVQGDQGDHDNQGDRGDLGDNDEDYLSHRNGEKILISIPLWQGTSIAILATFARLHRWCTYVVKMWKCWILSFEVCPTDKYVGEDPVSGGWSQSRPQVSRRYPPLVAISGQAGDNFLYFTFFVWYYTTLYRCPLVPAQ